MGRRNRAIFIAGKEENVFFCVQEQRFCVWMKGWAWKVVVCPRGVTASNIGCTDSSHHGKHFTTGADCQDFRPTRLVGLLG